MSYQNRKGISRSNAPLTLIKKQRSHLLLVFSNAIRDKRAQYYEWSMCVFRENLATYGQVLSINLLEKHEIDVTEGAYQEIPYEYLTIIELSLDGAFQAQELIKVIRQLHREGYSEGTPVTCLYYPTSERVGRSAHIDNTMLTIAFANPVLGSESEFHEWYCTRHIRHALNVPQLVSGQCFQRTSYQEPQAKTINYSLIAIYEQEGTPEEMIESFELLPEEILNFPALDLVNFSEWVYRKIPLVRT